MLWFASNAILCPNKTESVDFYCESLGHSNMTVILYINFNTTNINNSSLLKMLASFKTKINLKIRHKYLFFKPGKDYICIIINIKEICNK